MNNLFTPEHIVVNDLFGDNVKFIIPGYQRRYEWDCEGKSERNNQINLMWDDLYDFFLNNSNNKNAYFLGSMVMREVDNREFEVIDGQQRLTSLVILFASINCFLKKVSRTTIFANEQHKANFDTYFKQIIEDVEKKIFNSQRAFGSVVTKDKKVRIESNTVNVNFDTVLQNVLECNDNLIDNKYEEDNIISQRYYKNRNYFIKQFQTYFQDETEGFNIQFANKLDSFIGFLMDRVSIIRIKTINLQDAYTIFEILNNRGLPLSNKDLFRNFVIRKFAEIKAPEPETRWNYLELGGISDTFISRWVESTNAKQQKFSAFTEIENIFKRKYADSYGVKAIETFYKDVKSDLYNFQMLKNKHIPYEKQRIEFLLLFGNEKYIYNFLLAILRYINKFDVTTDDFVKVKELDKELDETIKSLHVSRLNKNNELSDELDKKLDELYEKQNNFSHIVNFKTLLLYFEQYIVYTQLKPGAKFSTKNINASIDAINRNEISEAVSHIKISEDCRKELAELINGEIRNNGTATNLILKYFWLTEHPKDNGKFLVDINNTTLEHIIPRTPADNSKWITDFSPKFRNYYTYRLGNMTLLSQPFNAAAKNYDFDKKKIEYEKTNFPLTRKLLETTLDEKFIENRHKEIVTTLLDDLSLGKINFVSMINTWRLKRV